MWLIGSAGTEVENLSGGSMHLEKIGTNVYEMKNSSYECLRNQNKSCIPLIKPYQPVNIPLQKSHQSQNPISITQQSQQRKQDQRDISPKINIQRLNIPYIPNIPNIPIYPD